MKKVVILGATGMLGHAVYAELKDKHDLTLTVRSLEKASLLEKRYGKTRAKIIPFDAALAYNDYSEKKGSPGPALENLLNEFGAFDWVINCVGVTIPFAMKDPALTFFVNGALPHVLAGLLREKFIHITTDCAFSGKSGFPYDEASLKTPADLYGLSKSLGEPAHCLTLRTSIIGRELEGFTGLLEWFLQQKGKTLTGFSEHFWNGITTNQYGKVMDRIISGNPSFPKTGLYHIFSNPVSKYEMLLKFEEKYKIGCAINSDKTNKLNRTLATVHKFNDQLKIPSFDRMIQEL